MTSMHIRKKTVTTTKKKKKKQHGGYGWAQERDGEAIHDFVVASDLAIANAYFENKENSL